MKTHLVDRVSGRPLWDLLDTGQRYGAVVISSPQGDPRRDQRGEAEHFLAPLSPFGFVLSPFGFVLYFFLDEGARVKSD